METVVLETAGIAASRLELALGSNPIFVIYPGE